MGKRLEHPMELVPETGHGITAPARGSRPSLEAVPVIPEPSPATSTKAVPSAHSLGARLAASALALATEPDLSNDVAVTGLIGLSQGSTTALEGALRRSRWRQFVRPSADADAATRLLRGALAHLGAGKAEASIEAGSMWWSGPEPALEGGGRRARRTSAASSP